MVPCPSVDKTCHPRKSALCWKAGQPIIQALKLDHSLNTISLPAARKRDWGVLLAPPTWREDPLLRILDKHFMVAESIPGGEDCLVLHRAKHAVIQPVTPMSGRLAPMSDGKCLNRFTGHGEGLCGQARHPWLQTGASHKSQGVPLSVCCRKRRRLVEGRSKALPGRERLVGSEEKDGVTGLSTHLWWCWTAVGLEDHERGYKRETILHCEAR